MSDVLLWLVIAVASLLILFYFMIRFGFEYLGYWLETRKRRKVWRAVQKKHMDLLRRKK